MQTFLPYPSFIESASCLDYRRLGKQRIEAKQILDILLSRTTSKAWRNHPCVNMWRGYEKALQDYYNSILREWIRRGYKNNMDFEIAEKCTEIIYNNLDGLKALELTNYHNNPKWLGNTDFHDAHKSNLLRKDPVFYGKYNWNVPDNLPYIWG